VLEHLFRAEEQAKSRVLRLETLLRLGGVDKIVSGYLDAAMGVLSDDDRDLASRILRRLVSPAGTKVGHSATELARLTLVPRADAERVLLCLEASSARVLRAVRDGAGEQRYEIVHELLTPMLVDWQQRYAIERQRRLAEAEIEGERKRLADDRRRAEERAQEELLRERTRADEVLLGEQRRFAEAAALEKGRAQAELDGEKERARKELKQVKRKAKEVLDRVRKTARSRLLWVLAAGVALLSGAGVLVLRSNAQAQNARLEASSAIARAEADRVAADQRVSEATTASGRARTEADRARAETERVKREASVVQATRDAAVAAAEAIATKANKRVVALQAGVELLRARLASVGVSTQHGDGQHPVSSSASPSADDLPPELRE
jgi:hypothetical protein